jgi:hypothetical protein
MKDGLLGITLASCLLSSGDVTFGWGEAFWLETTGEDVWLFVLTLFRAAGICRLSCVNGVGAAHRGLPSGDAAPNGKGGWVDVGAAGGWPPLLFDL